MTGTTSAPAAGDGGGGGPRRVRRTSIGVAAVVVVLIVAAGLFLAVRGGGSSPRTLPAPAAGSSPLPAAGASSPAAGGRAGPTDSEQRVPTTTPRGVTWSLYDGVALPFSAAAGPTRVDGPVAAGYAHTPLGALVAAEQIDSRSFVTPRGGWRQVTEQQVLPGPGRTAYIAARTKVSDEPPAAGLGQTAGFRFVTYSPDVAVIEYASKFPDGHLQATTSTVRWSAGDWRLELQPDGSTSPTVQPISELTGYVPWAGV